MKSFSFFAIALCAIMFVSCNNGGQQSNAGQSTVSGNNVTAQDSAVQDSTLQDSTLQDSTQTALQVNVPKAVTSFISSNFSGATINGTKRDNDDGDINVYLSDGSKVEFTANNEWKEISCRGKSVPSAFVPQEIANYVKSNYQSNLVSKIEKKINGYEIELNNGIELRFGANGQFLGKDGK